ncbi:hypothetical protein MKK84_00780, partial [Methylobacterium sp. E-065]|nr:hypothetical protein [Methylobacterium sp. E-065]
DYMRMVTLGANNVHEIDALMDEELETHHQEQERVVSAMQALADGTPAVHRRHSRPGWGLPATRPGRDPAG